MDHIPTIQQKPLSFYSVKEQTTAYYHKTTGKWYYKRNGESWFFTKKEEIEKEHQLTIIQQINKSEEQPTEED
jgi:hypothetical protein